MKKVRTKVNYLIPGNEGVSKEQLAFIPHKVSKEELSKLYDAVDACRFNIQGRSTSSKSVIVVGDMHIGHEFALASPLKKLRKVNEFWHNGRDNLLKERANIMVINGEPIDGDNPRENGRGLWEDDMGEQMEIANEYISDFKMDCIGITRGSNYHTTRGSQNFESILTKYLTAAPILDYTPYGRYFKRKRHSEIAKGDVDPVGHRRYNRIEDILQIRLHDVVFNFLHHTGVSSSFTYAPTSLATQMLKNLIVTGKLWSHKNAPTFTVRSHTHHFVLVEYGNSVGWVNPAWQIFSKYTLQKSMGAATIGFVEVVIESNNTFLIKKHILPDKDYPKIQVKQL